MNHFGLRLRWLYILTLASGFPLVAADGPRPITFQHLRVGNALVSLPQYWKSLGPELPVWVHLHGAPPTVERNFAAIKAPGVLVNITFPGASKMYEDYFADPRTFMLLLRNVEAALQNESAEKPWRLGRLTLSSFSGGFGGVRQLLRQPTAIERIDVLVMADSIYCGYAGAPTEKRVDD